MNLFELFVKIGVDDQASNKLSNLSNKLGSGLKTAAKIGTAAVGAAASGITALTTAAVNNYAEYEQLVGGVETLFSKSESAADSFANSIKNDAEAIKEFQRANNLAVDGILGPQTMAAIGAAYGNVQEVSTKAADMVMEYAANAYKTAGLSANEYMETVTSFSASLLQSLGGDTEAAAEYADRAVTDMSDNANKMGTSMEMIQNAYQGFAKQNYTMLDNLKLGYGGTKEEMARLIKEAAAMTDVQKELGIAVDATDMSFGNIVNAISVVQKNMKITGTTALEAGRTISGSVGAMKAAWTNLLTGLADGNADIEGLINNLVTTIVGDGTENNLGVLGNIMPAVKVALKGAAKVVAQSAPIIAEELPKLMEEILPDLASATANLIVALAEQIPSMAQTLVDAAYQIVDEIGNAFAERIPGLSAIFENLETVVISLTAAFVAYKAATAISEIIDTLRKATEGQTIAQTLLNAVMNANPFVLVATLIVGLVAAIVTLWNTNEGFRNAVISAWESIKSAAEKIFTAIANFFTETIPNAFQSMIDWISDGISSFVDIGHQIVDSIMSGISAAWDGLVSWFNGIWNSLFGSRNVDVNVNANATSSGVNGSHAGGLNYVPFDGYIAELHKGERVLTADEARGYNNRSNNSGYDERPIKIVVQSVLDGKVIGETAYNYNRRKARAGGT